MDYIKQHYLIIVILCAVGIVVFQAATLYLLGQPATCTCGVIKLWEGVVFSPGNSQQFSDWYTFSHIIHGFIFYLFFWLLFPRSKLGTRLLLAIALETCWEIAENTPMVIEAYRNQTLASGYTGDSILNSVFDNLAMITGFFLAHRISIILIIILGISFELFAGYFIHDNLTLNILNFIYQFEFITTWQAGG